MEQRPEFDREFANALIGKHVLVGLTYLNEAGDAEEGSDRLLAVYEPFRGDTLKPSLVIPGS